MSDTEEFAGPQAPFTITLKGGSGYDKPWLVLRAESAEDAVALLGEAQANELLDRIAEYSAEFQTKNGAASSAGDARQSGPPSRSGRSSTQGRGSGPGSSGAAPQNSDVEYHPEGLTCPKAGCGQAVFLKSGKSRAGNNFQVWTCPNQAVKNDGHFSQYVN